MEPVETAELARWFARIGLPLVFLGPLLEIPLPVIPGDAVLVLAGWLAARGSLPLPWVLVLGFLGACAGISTTYLIGRALGAGRAQHLRRSLRLDERRLARVRRWYERRGRISLIVGFFIPGVRHIVAVVAGMSRLAPAPFALFAFTGAAAWSSTLVLLGYYLGGPVLHFVLEHLPWAGLVATIGIAIAFATWLAARRRRARHAAA